MVKATSSKKITSYNELEQQASIEFSYVKDFLKQHITFSIALFYLTISAFGLAYIYLLSRIFKINILPHLEISDYILAPIHYPLIIIFVALIALGTWIGLLVEKQLRKNKKVTKVYDKINKPLYYFNPLFGYTCGGLALVIIALDMSSEKTYDNIIAEKNQFYTLSFSSTVEINDTPVMNVGRVQIIADTVKYLWIYDKDKNIHAVPQKNIASLIPIKTTDNKAITSAKQSQKAKTNESSQ